MGAEGSPPDRGTSPKRPRLVDQLRKQQLPPPGTRVSSGITAEGADGPRLWLGHGLTARPIGPAGSWSIGHDGSSSLDVPAPALLEFSDGRFAATVVLPRLFACVVRDDYGVTGLVYCDLDAPRGGAAPVEEALAALDSGALRADTADDLAVRLREWKHADPVLGVISAYLYDATGDIDSIRRMASFYVQHGQAIPYDIALLGGLHGGRTEHGFVVEVPEVKEREPRTDAERDKPWTHCRMDATRGLVGGLWPWMRQGWIFLDDPGDVGSPLILPGLVGRRPGLTRSRFATLEKDAAHVLAGMCGLHPLAIS